MKRKILSITLLGIMVLGVSAIANADHKKVKDYKYTASNSYWCKQGKRNRIKESSRSKKFSCERNSFRQRKWKDGL